MLFFYNVSLFKNLVGWLFLSTAGVREKHYSDNNNNSQTVVWQGVINTGATHPRRKTCSKPHSQQCKWTYCESGLS